MEIDFLNAAPRNREGRKGKDKHRTMKKAKFSQCREKNMFASSLDPYDRELGWWEKEHVKNAFSYQPQMLRLNILVGSHIVRLTDRQYMLLLASRLIHNYQIQQQTRIEERQKLESVRMKEMILKHTNQLKKVTGEIRKYPLFQLYLYSEAVIKQLKEKGKSKTCDNRDLYNLLYTNEEVETSQDVVEGEVQSQSEEVEAESTATDKDIAEGYVLTAKEYEGAVYETGKVRELANIEDVETIYAKAREIVGVLYSHVDEGRYEKQTETQTNDKQAEVT